MFVWKMASQTAAPLQLPQLLELVDGDAKAVALFVVKQSYDKKMMTTKLKDEQTRHEVTSRKLQDQETNHEETKQQLVEEKTNHDLAKAKVKIEVDRYNSLLEEIKSLRPLAAEVKLLQLEKTKNCAQIDTLQSDLSDKEKKVEDLEKDNANISRNVFKMQAERKELDKQRDEQEKDNVKLTKRAEIMNKIITAQKVEIEKQTAAASTATAEKDKLLTDNDLLKEDLTKAKRQRKEAQKDQRKARKSLLTAEEKILALNKVVNIGQLSSDNVQGRLEIFVDEVKNQKKDFQDAKNSAADFVKYTHGTKKTKDEKKMIQKIQTTLSKTEGALGQKIEANKRKADKMKSQNAKRLRLMNQEAEEPINLGELEQGADVPLHFGDLELEERI